MPPLKAAGIERPYGKSPRRILEDVVYRNLGVNRQQIMVGPKRGFDNAVISLGNARVMILTTDPVSIIPAFRARTSAWLSVHLIASDYTTSGLEPEFASFNFNFPPELSTSDEEAYLKGVGSACKELGVAIVAGHTGAYPGAGFTVIGGGVMFGFGNEGGYVDPSMANPGDAVIMTKSAALEAATSLANSFPQYTSSKIGASRTRRAQALVRSCTTVHDALTAASVGLGDRGVTSMHDATEGGVLGALDEMAFACGHSLVVEKEPIPVGEEARAVCDAFRIDPLRSLSEGVLLLTCNPDAAGDLMRKLRRNGTSATQIGQVRTGTGSWLAEPHGRPRRITPYRDPYWGAYSRAVSAGLS